MNYQEILGKIKDLVVEQLDVAYEQVTPKTRLINDLDADSLDLAELAMEAEDEFDLDIPEDEPAIYTVGDLAKYVANQLGVEIPKE